MAGAEMPGHFFVHDVPHPHQANFGLRRLASLCLARALPRVPLPLSLNLSLQS